MLLDCLHSEKVEGFQLFISVKYKLCWKLGTYYNIFVTFIKHCVRLDWIKSHGVLYCPILPGKAGFTRTFTAFPVNSPSSVLLLSKNAPSLLPLLTEPIQFILPSSFQDLASLFHGTSADLFQPTVIEPYHNLKDNKVTCPRKLLSDY